MGVRVYYASKEPSSKPKRKKRRVGKKATDEGDQSFKMFKLAVTKKKNVPARGPLGLRFNRDPNGGKSPHYVGNRAQKAQFRLDWAKSIFEDMKRTKTRTESLTNTDGEGGKYLSRKQVTHEEKSKKMASPTSKSAKRGDHHGLSKD